jgi:hypothetical protein
MDDTSAHTADRNQAEEEFFTYTVSDEALEAAAGTESGRAFTINSIQFYICC